MIKKWKITVDKRTTGILFILFVIAWMSGLSSAAGMVSPDGKSSSVDLGIFSSGCGDFEIRAKPLINLTETVVTNIVFTVRWPENTVNLLNFTSAFDIVQQGPVYQSGGFNYAVFSSATPVPISWSAGNEYVLLSFSHDRSGTGYADFIIAGDAWTQANNGLYYIEMLGIDNTGILYHQVQNTYLGDCDAVDIGIFNTGCAEFEVRLKPHVDYLNHTLTNIQFTIKWPANSVNLFNVVSEIGPIQHGPVEVVNDTIYCVFVSVSNNPVDWVAETEVTILTFLHDQTGLGVGDFAIDTYEWANTHNGAYYVELTGLDYTGIVYHNAENSYLAECGIVDVRVLLQGPWDASSGRMNTTLNAAGNLPPDQPFNMAPWNYMSNENVSSFPDSIVDWVLVELRDKVNNTLTIERRAGLVSKTGIVMETDMTRGLRFTSAENLDNYFIVVWHRNHMPVMSGLPVALPNLGAPYDFTEVAVTQPYKHNEPLPAELELDPPGSGRYGMIAGDINANKELKYLGANDDRGLILARIISVSGLPDLNTVINGYYNEDITLDNQVIYLGPADDRSLILNNLYKLTGSANLNSIYYSVVP